jgi:pimeloyl-ACP methyl ester carboxylesterase
MTFRDTTACHLLFALLLAAAPAAAQNPSFPALADDAPAGSGVVRACDILYLHGTARCGVFRVYEDRAAAAGRTLDIAFIILDALEPSRRQADGVLLLPGGPGESFTGVAAPISRGRPELRRQRDVVLVDVRGVGRSATLSCMVPYPGGFESRFGTVFPPDHAAACRDELAGRARLDSYTSAAAVDDIEELRRWLGYPSWNLIGGSYGTRVAQVYMRRHPAAVRTAVLNGVASVAEQLYVQHAALLQRALERLIAECAADAACGAAYPRLGEDLERVFARFRAGPVEVEV